MTKDGHSGKRKHANNDTEFIDLGNKPIASILIGKDSIKINAIKPLIPYIYMGLII